MSYRLYVRPLCDEGGGLPDEASPWVYDWLLVDAGGDAQASGLAQSRDEIEQTLKRNDLENVRLVGLIPAENVLYCSARLPGKQSRYIRQALPFAVEEQLAQSVESMHLALGSKHGETFSVAAIHEPLMADIMARLNHWQIELQAIYADAMLLPVSESTWTLCIEGDYTMGAAADGGWFRVLTDNLPVMLDALPVPAEATSPTLRVFITEAARESQQLSLATIEQSERFQVRVETLELSSLELLAHAHQHHLSDPVNLAQDAFAPPSRQGGLWQRWRAVAVIAGVWFVLQLGLDLGQGFYYQHQARSWEHQAVGVYKSIFPNETRVNAGNLKRILEGKLRVASQQGGQQGFLPLMKQAGYQYSQMPDRGQLSFDSISYSRNSGQLVIEVHADTFDKLNELKNGLVNAGYKARIGSVVNDKNRARGRITISGS